MSKTVTDTTQGSMEVEYETNHGLSIGTMDFDELTLDDLKTS